MNAADILALPTAPYPRFIKADDDGLRYHIASGEDGSTAVVVSTTPEAFAAADLDKRAAFLRGIGGMGYQALGRAPSKALRLMNKVARRRRVGLHTGVKTLCIGDSVAVHLGPALQRLLGYGGDAVPSAGLAGDGPQVFDMARVPSGYHRTLTAGQYLEISPTAAHQSFGVSFLTTNGAASFKMQYRLKGADGLPIGNWIDATNAWVQSFIPKSPFITNAGSATALSMDSDYLIPGMLVTGDGIPNGTTIVSINTAPVVVSGTLNGTTSIVLASAVGVQAKMTVAGTGIPAGARILSVSGNTIVLNVAATTSGVQTLTISGKTVTLSQAATAGNQYGVRCSYTDVGSDLGGGVYSTDNSAAGGVVTFGRVWKGLPNGGPFNAGDYADLYSVRVVGVSGTVSIVEVIANAGAYSYGGTNSGYQHYGALSHQWNASGMSLAGQFINTTQHTWDRALALADPDIITFKTFNSISRAALEEHWETYANRIRQACPSALFVVVGLHNWGGQTERDDAGLLECDDYWRDWCARTDGAIFVDMLAEFPDYTDAWTIDDVWSDGLHIYGTNEPNGGGYEAPVNAIMDILQPTLERCGFLATTAAVGATGGRAAPGWFNEIHLQDPNASNMVGQTPYLSVIGYARQDNYFVIRHPGGGVSSNTSYGGFAGFGMRHLAQSTCGGALELVSQGNKLASFQSTRGWFISTSGDIYGRNSNLNGGLILGPATTWGSHPALVVEHYSGSTAKILGLNRNGTTAAGGAELWSWMPDGTIIYEGITADNFETTFTFQEPAADTTLYHPVGAVAGTGSNARYNVVAPGYATQSSGQSTVGYGEVFWDEATGRARAAVIEPGYTVGTLPSAATAGARARAFVTDSNATHAAGIGAVVAAGGANFVPVYSDGTNWRIG